MTRKPIFWITLTILSLACTVFAYWFFPRAFPIVSLNITMTRAAALESAATLAEQHGWGPVTEARSAVSFSLDNEVQTFVELEGGGAEAFKTLLNDPVYTPYNWRVRRFRTGDVNESNIFFRPDGRPFGFSEKIAEDAVRPNLSADSARALAERTAATVLQIDLTTHELVESGQEQRAKGRIDHTFMYERKDASLGDGRFRVKVIISGDRVSEIMPGVRVPEAFQRRYQEMRSANSTIGTASSVGAIILYLLIGCGIGCFYLLRKRALLWRPAVVVAAVITTTLILAGINEWPLLWLQYDTALSAGRYVMQTLLSIIIIGIALGAVMAATFMTAEGLSRLAFPDHPQLWQIWRRDAAPTLAIAGRTAAGYLAMPLMLTYVMLFYFIAGRLWGWWNPSEALVNPDSLAHYAPWLTPFANAMQAGVWEECLFRAVPLAGAALLGQRFGRRNLFIGVTLVLQAFIFGAAHATYPAQPAYARLVELIIPSLLFGIFYLRFGLLPSIILHFTFDIVLMALPIFASTGAGVWSNRVLVVLLMLSPALVVLVRRGQSGNWLELPAGLRNAAWLPPAIVAETPASPSLPLQQPDNWPRHLLPALAVFCMVALPVSLWMQAQMRPVVPVLEISKAEAETIARQTLVDRGIELPAGMRALVSILGEPGMEDRFIWQTAGRDVYETLIGDWLHPPRYFVRFARFEGDVAERAEEWMITITRNGSVRTVRHTIAEDIPGANLSEEQARALALSGIERDLKVSPDTVRVVSVEPKKQPARADWVITYADTTGAALPQGERRLRVDIAGDEVTGAVKMIHVPEEWQRQMRADDVAINGISILRAMILLGVVLTGVITAIVGWSRGRFSVRYFLVTTGLVLVAGVMVLANNVWPAATAQFSTAQSFTQQAARNFALLGMLVGVGALGAGLIVGMTLPWRRATGIPGRQLVLAGILWAIVIRCLSIAPIFPFGTAMPAWPNTGDAIASLPLLAQTAANLISYCMYTLPALLVFGVAGRYTAGWTRRRALAFILLFMWGAIFYGSTAAGSVSAWAVSALAMGLVTAVGYWLLVRHDLAVIAVITAASIVMDLLPKNESAYPGAYYGNILAIIVITGVGWLLFNTMRRIHQAESSEPVQGS